MNDDSLDDLLDRSSPPTSVMTDQVAGELQRLRTSTAISVRTTPRWLRPAVAGLAAIALVGIGSAAVATGTWVLPWAERDALASVEYTTPSGLECELRIGGVTTSVPEVLAGVEDFYRTTDFDALLTPGAIQATIGHIREGERLQGGYGTADYDADAEYSQAVLDIVFTAMDDDLARRGLAFVDPDWSLQAEPSCPGAAG